jgi:hypothetical protein
MQIRTILFIFLILCGVSKAFTQEKIHVQLDRNTYAIGETIWFNAQIVRLNSNIGGSLLQVELLKADSVVTRVHAPIVLSIANGQLVVPQKLESGWSQLRAFTERREASLFSTFIYIIGNKKNNLTTTSSFNDSILLTFFPESNKLVVGIESTVAFKATTPYGEPRMLQGVIKDQTGREICNFQSWHDGMGTFSLTPEKNQQYIAVFTANGKTITQNLPAIASTGTILSVINHPEGFFFEVKSTEKTISPQELTLVGYLQGVEVFKSSLSFNRDYVQGVLKTKNLQSDILEIQLQNSIGEILSKRNVFVNNEEYRVNTQLITDTLSTASKSKNSWRLQLLDTIQGNISISITDADRDFFVNRPPSIISQLLLTAELAEQVYNPDWYFNTSKDSAEIGLDLLLLTTPKRARSYATGVNSSTQQGEGFINVKGQAFLRDSKQPLANSELITVLSAKGLRNQLFLTPTDKDGRFIIDSLLFFGPARFYFGEQRFKKLPRYIDVRLQEKSIPLIQLDSNSHLSSLLTLQQLPAPEQSLQNEMLQRILEAEGRMLEEVRLTAKKKSPLEKLEEEYTSGPFNTNAFVERVIDFVNTNDPIVHPTIFDYIRSRIPGLVVVDPDYSSRPPDPSQPGFDPRNDPTKYRIFYRQMPSVSSMGNPPMAVFLNEIDTDTDILLTIPTSDIAYVKIFSSFVAAAGSAPGGAIAIYTKKSYHQTDTVGSAVTYTGYSENNPFQSPNFLADPTLFQKPDYRITLEWQPTLLLNNVNPSIPIRFFNNDRTKRFRLIVQGITANGKLIYKEEIIQKN